ncbi:MAG: superoxide dismutase family protein [Phycisphaeraceae bacterium]|nr:superoxide dismutase family protein [Phycisphaeraceae bacterium]
MIRPRFLLPALLLVLTAVLTAYAAQHEDHQASATDASDKPASCPMTDKPAACPADKSSCPDNAKDCCPATDKAACPDKSSCPDKSKASCTLCMSVTHAVAVLTPTAGSTVTGAVNFYQTGCSVKVVADLQGLPPNSTHGFHVHEFGDVSSPDGAAAGGHYNPKDHPHALPDSEHRHAGDLGNITSDDQGNAHLELTADNLTLAGPKAPILGRALIVHADPDDGSQPTGNAGARIAQGVIAVAKPVETMTAECADKPAAQCTDKPAAACPMCPATDKKMDNKPETENKPESPVS